MSNKSDKNKSKDIETLIDFGLSPTESLIYTALLNIGGGSVNSIATHAGIKRTTTYSTIDNLIKLGLARYDSDGFKRKIVAEDPVRLKQILEEKKLKLEQTLPSFQELFNLKRKTSDIRQYTGIKSIKPLYEKLIRDIRPNQDYFVMSNQEMWLKQDPVFFNDFSIRRGKLPITIKMILEDNPSSWEYYNNRRLYNIEVRFLPKNVKLTTNLVVTPQRTLIQQLVQPIVALEIENESITLMHQEMFKIIWSSLPTQPI